MHSFNYDDGLSFHFHGDFSGNVIIEVKEEVETGHTEYAPIFETVTTTMSIPAEALVQLVARHYVLPRKLNALERLDDDEILFDIT